MSDKSDQKIIELEPVTSDEIDGCFTIKQIREIAKRVKAKFTLSEFAQFVSIGIGSLSGCSRISGLVRQDGSWGGWWNKSGNKPAELPPSTDPDFVWIRKGPPIEGVNPPPEYEIDFDSKHLFLGEDGNWDRFPVCYRGSSPNDSTAPEVEE